MMKRVVVDRFGGPEVLRVASSALSEPGAGEVRVRLTSIGMNHADLMARRGEYKLSSGDPPFTPGIEGGGVIDAIGPGVAGTHKIGERVVLGMGIRSTSAGGHGGTYRSHYYASPEQCIHAPKAVPDNQLGALWLPYLTAWGCLVWKQQIKRGDFVAMTAASSSVALAAAQVVKQQGGVAIGLTSSAEKVDQIRALPACAYQHLVVTHNKGAMLPWHRDLKSITGGSGVDVFFDPVGSGAYLDAEIRSLAQHGTIWVYGLLGDPGAVDVSPLIRKHAAIRGWLVGEMNESPDALKRGYDAVLRGFSEGAYVQHVAREFRLDDVRAAHEYMERGEHVGKLVLVP